MTADLIEWAADRLNLPPEAVVSADYDADPIGTGEG